MAFFSRKWSIEISITSSFQLQVRVLDDTNAMFKDVLSMHLSVSSESVPKAMAMCVLSVSCEEAFWKENILVFDRACKNNISVIEWIWNLSNGPGRERYLQDDVQIVWDFHVTYVECMDWSFWCGVVWVTSTDCSIRICFQSVIVVM